MYINKDTIVKVPIYILLVLILTNFNFVLLIFQGTLGLLSPVILFLTIVSLLFVFTFQKNKVGVIFLFFLTFISIYLLNASLSIFDFTLKVSDYITDLSNYIKSLLILFIFYFYFKKEDSKGKIDKHMMFIAVILTLANTSIFLMDYYEMSVRLNFDKTIIEDKWARASGIWGNANKAAAFCLLNIILLMYFSLKFRLKLINLFSIFSVILFLFYNIYLTLSNTMFIVSIVIISIYAYFFSIQLKLNTKLKIIAMSFAGMMLFLFFYGNSIYQQYENLSPAKKEKITNVLSILDVTSSKKVSFSDRDVVLKVGFEKILNRPFLGNGLGSFKKNIFKVDGIHNQFVQIIGEGGFVPFLFFLLFFLLLIHKTLKIKETSLKFLLYCFLIFFILFGIVTHGLFIVNGYCIIFALFFVLFERESLIS